MDEFKLKTEAETIILLFLSKEDYNSIRKTVTLNAIKEKTNICYMTVYKTITHFKELGYVAEGLQRGRFKTFYITDKGLNVANLARKKLAD